MQPNQAQELLFTDTITLEESRPASFVLTGPTGYRAAIERSEAVLAALSMIEEARHHDDDGDPNLRRLEAKVDILTSIIARTLLKADQDRDRPLRWSARGAELVSDVYFETGSQGVLRIALSERVPEAVNIPAVVAAIEPEDETTYRMWVEFVGLGAEFIELLGQHLFRAQRRAIAELRRTAQA